ncbi:LysM peptidoglycan-binding domain-containing protein [Leucobacter allii]|uniref:LysM peptidoglycan-binding domain-containing protein n=1 Tax=Leucobacter allii TaxID=2932247 RepID=A0ABY4FPP1_9MICO|nr:LysM peptidoglycan-binding domain-containing protein [Leucobacter allii]UOQ58246.1 LysM peptidoglycan-binding domain-containing protein [Leucobacter allii]UOR02828.1 LysM peptidoglycan-binding domain-containing protein [Leucobacter allii]
MSAQAMPEQDLRGAVGAVRLRLTRRGRVVLGGLATIAVAGVLALLATFSAPQAVASDAASGESFPYVVVQSGSSLWELATALDPAADPRDVVAEIVRLNQLDGSGVDAGQPLAVPLRYAESPVAVSAEELGL